ncbi:MAG: 2,3-bisphosphoglycerate-independent phosphoglycerate mutase [Bacteroidales bacterium]|nr:2,3-bisphosphoglycerate-independent phosphoglycerate mutase [Bacteroidales bacterium]
MLSELYFKIRLFTLWGKKSYFLLYKLLGFIPNNLEIYREALSHASIKATRKDGERLNNERLEFLGDTILDTIVSDILYHKYPNEREGFLTNMRSSIVQRKSLDKIAQQMNISDILSVSYDITLFNNHIGGNALEALIGAIYLDKGYDVCRKFVKDKIVTPYIDMDKLAQTEENYKSRLMEWCQKNRVDIDYILLDNHTENGNCQIFKFEVFIEGIACGRGKGRSKKAAQQEAARKAYKLILNDKEVKKRIFDAQNYSKLAENRVTSQKISELAPEHTENESNNNNKIIKTMSKKALLMILDGWGIGNHDKADVIYNTPTPYWDYLVSTYPNSQLQASGENVGLPDGQMGNSEVGHLNIGAGRIVYQDLVKINKACKENTILQNPEIVSAFSYAKENGKNIHFMGLTSDGGVHSSLEHLYKLCDIAKEYAIDNCYIHCFMDGRDTDPKSGKGFIEALTEHCSKSAGRIASIIGRYYAMDRDKRWERVKEAYDLLVKGVGKKAEDMVVAMQESYDEGITDEFIKPIVNSSFDGTIKEGDVVIFFNYRNDRAKELTIVLTQQDMPEEGMMTIPGLQYYCMTPYDASFKGVHILFDKENVVNTLGEYLASKGKTQLHIAETEKYAHVTFFFNGGRETPYDNEERILVPSPKVATYDLKPEMSAYEVKDKLVEAIKSDKFDFIVVNFANGDMVGHTGIYEAIEKAVVAVDACVKDVIEAAKATGYEAIIIADHGNADNAVNSDNTPNTAHSLNPVPCVYVTENKSAQIENGILADVAPTILNIMGMEQPTEMSGKNLIK